MRKTPLICFLFVIAACNQQQHTNETTKKSDNTGSHKTDVDSSISKQEALVDSTNLHFPKISYDVAVKIADSIITDSITNIKYGKYNISKVFSENGWYLVKAQRYNAIFDKYLDIEYKMDNWELNTDTVVIHKIDFLSKSGVDVFTDSILWANRIKYFTYSTERNIAMLDAPLKEILEYLKTSNAVIEVLDYADLRYGQTCNPTEPNRSKFVTAYLISHGIAPSRFVAVGFGYDEPCIMSHDDGIFKKGDTLTGFYIANLKSEKDKKKAYKILESKQVEIIVLPEKK